MANHYFSGDRAFWDDDDFPDFYCKYVYSELWQADGIDIIGVRTRNDAIEAARLKLSVKKYREVLNALDGQNKIKIYDNIVWIKAALWWNLNKGNFSDQQMTGVVTRLKGRGAHPIVSDLIGYYCNKYSLYIPYTYPIDTGGGVSTVHVPDTVPVPVPVQLAESKDSVGKPTPEEKPKRERSIPQINQDRVVEYLSKRFGLEIKSELYSQAGAIYGRFKTWGTTGDEAVWILDNHCRDPKSVVDLLKYVQRIKVESLEELTSSARKNVGIRN